MAESRLSNRILSAGPCSPPTPLSPWTSPFSFLAFTLHSPEVNIGESETAKAISSQATRLLRDWVLSPFQPLLTFSYQCSKKQGVRRGGGRNTRSVKKKIPRLALLLCVCRERPEKSWAVAGLGDGRTGIE